MGKKIVMLVGGSIIVTAFVISAWIGDEEPSKLETEQTSTESEIEEKKETAE